MLSAAQTVEYVLEGINDVYSRPEMFGETAETVEAVLHLYHDLWAAILEREADFVRAGSSVRSEEIAFADSFGNNFARLYPQSTESERTAYAISRWQEIDKLLALAFGDGTNQRRPESN
jgi:hypothetical protein